VVIQFIKGKRDAATRLLRHPRLHWHCAGGGFTWTMDVDAGRSDCETGWQMAAASLGNPAFDLVMLDELNIALACDYLEIDRVLAALAARPAGQHVIITGRHAAPELMAMADLVTEMREVKHPFAAGVPAQCGIEF
jgi:cob(I)alamin adenosyltransferase